MRALWTVIGCLPVLCCYYLSLSEPLWTFTESPTGLVDLRRNFLGLADGRSPLLSCCFLLPHLLVVLGALLLVCYRAWAALLSCIFGVSVATFLASLAYHFQTTSSWVPARGLYLWGCSALLLAFLGFIQAAILRRKAPAAGSRPELPPSQVAHSGPPPGGEQSLGAVQQ